MYFLFTFLRYYNHFNSLDAAQISFAAYTDPYYNSLFNGYGPQAIVSTLFDILMFRLSFLAIKISRT